MSHEAPSTLSRSLVALLMTAAIAPVVAGAVMFLVTPMAGVMAALLSMYVALFLLVLVDRR